MSSLDAATVAAEMQQLREQVAGCTACELHRGATCGVPGEGPVPAEVMLIGEAPGYHEDRQGKPFIGAAGHFLNELLHSIELDRSEVYITNVVKHRPPGNRDPLPDEIAACSPYLDRQLALVRPKLVVTLGRFSMARWFAGQRISQIHGQPKRFGNLTVVPMYHPAAALHQGALKATIQDDFLKLPRILVEIRQRAEAEEQAAAPKVEQMKLF